MSIQRHFRPLIARDRDQAYRVATQLELLFDLVVVIAIAAAAHGLVHEIERGHPLMGILQYGLAFFVIWWPWKLFTFFASSFDNDDFAYRFSVMVMMCGSMLVAASMPIIFEHGRLTYDFLGYIIFRLVSALLWLRAARANPHLRQTAWRYSIGQILMQGVWAIALFAVPLWSIWTWGVIAIAIVGELLVPWYAEQAGAPPWHRRHIIERFGSLNIVVIGEALLSSTRAITNSIHQGGSIPLLVLAGCGAVMGFSLWWLYFCDEEHLDSLTQRRRFVWGYGHFLVLASGAAVGAGLSVMVSALSVEPSDAFPVPLFPEMAAVERVSPEVASWAISIPLGLYILGVWLVRDRYRLKSVHSSLLIFFSVVVALSGALPHAPIPSTLLVVICLVLRLRSS